MYLLVPGFEPTSSALLGKCVTRWATVADAKTNATLSLHINQY